MFLSIDYTIFNPGCRMPSNKSYVAIIDIGSNAVRLVVYDGLNRAPVRIHNERNICHLGADIVKTGKLNPEGIRSALSSLGRFSGLLEAMNVSKVYAVATAAVRDAKDGRDFIQQVEKDYGLKVMVIDGEEEARLTALGVLMNGLGRDGIIGDYGGGSLELIEVHKGEILNKASLPLGSHRLHALPSREDRIAVIEKHLDSVEFLENGESKNFYALGGAWRGMALAHMHMTDHPLLVLDHYTMDGVKAASFAELISKQSPAALEKTAGLPEKRLKDMGVAALAMERLLQKLNPSRVIFSATGLREGLLFDHLPAALQEQDVLMAGCRKIALKISRFDNLKDFNTLMHWMTPLFKDHDVRLLRLLEASCLLSDTGWFEHEDYQARHAFERILILPLYGIDHVERAFLAMVQYARYAGSFTDKAIQPVRTLLNDDAVDLANMTGRALRLGYLMTGGALSLLKDSSLAVSSKNLTLTLSGKSQALNADLIGKSLNHLASAIGKKAVIA